MNDSTKLTLNLWNEENYFELGQYLCSQIPIDEQPAWFAYLLDLASMTKNRNFVIQELLDVIPDKFRWLECREIFNRLRCETIKAEKLESENSTKLGVLLLAENIAKLTFNCDSDTSAGFDRDVGFWIPECIKYIIDNSEDDQMNDELLRYLLRL